MKFYHPPWGLSALCLLICFRQTGPKSFFSSSFPYIRAFFLSEIKKAATIPNQWFGLGLWRLCGRICAPVLFDSMIEDSNLRKADTPGVLTKGSPEFVRMILPRPAFVNRKSTLLGELPNCPGGGPPHFLRFRQSAQTARPCRLSALHPLQPHHRHLEGGALAALAVFQLGVGPALEAALQPHPVPHLQLPAAAGKGSPGDAG